MRREVVAREGVVGPGRQQQDGRCGGWGEINCQRVLRRVAAERRYAKRLARTKPTTPAGVAALIQYVLDDDLVDDEDFWHVTALRSAVAALNRMGAAVQS